MKLIDLNDSKKQCHNQCLIHNINLTTAARLFQFFNMSNAHAQSMEIISIQEAFLNFRNKKRLLCANLSRVLSKFFSPFSKISRLILTQFKVFSRFFQIILHIFQGHEVPKRPKRPQQIAIMIVLVINKTWKRRRRKFHKSKNMH